MLPVSCYLFFEKRETAVKRQRKEERWGYFFLIPWALFFFVFTLFPFLFGILVSFTDYSLSGMRFNGLANYRLIFTQTAFIRSTIATFSYAAIIIPLTIALSLWISYEIHERSGRFNSFVKASLYLPGVTTQSALTIVWKFLLIPSFGLIATLLARFGFHGSLLDSPASAIPIISVLIVLVTLGQPVILFTAAMNSIPVSYYEAAWLEGASRFSVFRHITLPLISPTTKFILVTNTIGILQLFVVPYLMTGGGPAYRTSTLLLLVYNSAFINGSFGYASAIGNILFIMTSLLAVIQFWIMRRDIVEY